MASWVSGGNFFSRRLRRLLWFFFSCLSGSLSPPGVPFQHGVGLFKELIHVNVSLFSGFLYVVEHFLYCLDELEYQINDVRRRLNNTVPYGVEEVLHFVGGLAELHESHRSSGSLEGVGISEYLVYAGSFRPPSSPFLQPLQAVELHC